MFILSNRMKEGKTLMDIIFIKQRIAEELFDMISYFFVFD